jgi:cell division septal protein FtsQ
VLWGPVAVRQATESLIAALHGYRVRDIRVLGAKHIDAREIKKLSGIMEGTPLFQIGLKSVCKKIRSHPWIRSAIAVRRLPDTIELRVTEHEPVALLIAQQVVAVTSDSVLIPMGESKTGWDLPVLRTKKTLSVSNGHLRDTLACALLAQSVNLRQWAPRMWKNLSELYWRDGEMWGILQEETVELRLGKGVQEIGWKSLDRLMPKLRAAHKMTDVESIDLRFPDRVVVRYHPQQTDAQSSNFSRFIAT